MARIEYNASRTLSRLHRSDAFVRCVVGPVGSGKSSACCLEILLRAAQQAPSPDGVRRTRFAVIRNTYRQLKDTTRKTFEQWIPAAAGTWREQDFTFTVDKPLGDGTRMHCEVLFRALDRPEDVKKLLSLELTGAYINEARELPKHVFDVLQTRVGRYPSKAQGGATWFGIWMDTNPWHTNHWGYRLFTKQRPEGHELFEQPDALGPRAENLENLPRDYYERLCLGKDTEWIDEYIRSQYPSHEKGSIYGDLIAAVEARSGVLDFQHPVDDLFTVWDLGRDDSTSIWFFRFRNGDEAEALASHFGRPNLLVGAARSSWDVDVVDFYENHGQALSHYFNVLNEKQKELGYRYVKHYLPHDARARTLATQVSVLDQFISQYGTGAVEIIPALDVLDGIQAARALLERPIRFHGRCDESPLPGVASGLEALRAYRYAWDEVNKVFSRTPVHDWSSHAADAFRYLALAEKAAEARTRSWREANSPEPPKPATTLEQFKRWQQPKAKSRRIG